MNTETLTFFKIAGTVAGVIISLPLVLAAGRAFFFFGGMERTVSRMELDMKEGRDALTRFQERVLELYDNHETRILTMEVERRAEETIRLGRRDTDVAIVAHRDAARSE